MVVAVEVERGALAERKRRQVLMGMMGTSSECPWSAI
jgi:hypothetical protein